ncbi:hypothetical protein FRC03_007010 [Tulasnella sp. 419]|nr:hypothetical protein FRC03_007010 [Tulasnella sp. 419]
MDQTHIEFNPTAFHPIRHSSVLVFASYDIHDSLELGAIYRRESGRCVLRGFLSKHNQLARPQNNTSAINTLPNEILSDIMVECVEDLGVSTGLIATIHLASVCFRWHQVVHGSPRMWSHLDDRMGTDRIAICLAKSKDAPLTISCALWIQESMNLFISNIHRWRSFTSVLDPTSTSDMSRFDIAKLLSTKSAPLIEEITLPGWTLTEAEPSIKLLQGKTPRLRHLETGSFSIDWSTLPFSNLTYLDIGAPNTVSGYVEQYYHLLSSCSNLEHLEIRGRHHPHIPVEPPFSSPNQKKSFLLPHLRVASFFRLAPEVIELLLSSIEVSNSPYIKVAEIANVMGQSSEVVLSLPLPTQTLLPAALSHSRTLVLYQSSDVRICCDGMNKHFDVSISEDPRDDDINVVVELGSAAILFEALISIPMCLSQITSLQILGECFFPNISSIRLLGVLTELSCLRLACCAQYLDEFFKFLSTGNPSGAQTRELPCHKLRQLVLKEVTSYSPNILVEAMAKRYGSPEQTAILPLELFHIVEEEFTSSIFLILSRLQAILGKGVCSVIQI